MDRWLQGRCAVPLLSVTLRVLGVRSYFGRVGSQTRAMKCFRQNYLKCLKCFTFPHPTVFRKKSKVLQAALIAEIQPPPTLKDPFVPFQKPPASMKLTFFQFLDLPWPPWNWDLHAIWYCCLENPFLSSHPRPSTLQDAARLSGLIQVSLS